MSYSLYAQITIIDKPIIFNEERISLTKEYILKRYTKEVNTIEITPRMIVIHWTAIKNFDVSFNRFVNPRLPSDRKKIIKASILNVSAHFLVDRDGTIYRLMPETFMARHIIGLNFNSICIENVGGEGSKDDLTSAQLASNLSLISYLQNKYKHIEYLIGHSEYTNFTKHSLWLETDDNYRTTKYDPGKEFMFKLRQHFPSLKGSP